MTQSLTSDQLLTMRMSAQGLLPPASGSDAQDNTHASTAAPSSAAERIAQTARHMLAVQGQDWRSARWALGLRTPGSHVEDVHSAFNRGLIVRSWPMRGTIHLLAAEDIGWMQHTTNRRVLAGAPKRREFLGITDHTLDRLVETSVAALTGSTGMERDELAATWSEAGIEWQSNWRYHLIWWLCQNGIAVLGPVSEKGEPRLVLASEWIASPKQLSGDEALLELAARYAKARGAVTAKDLAWWSGLTASEARLGLTHATEAGYLVECATERDGKIIAIWCDPIILESHLAAPSPGSQKLDGPQWLLLPAFDEHLLGYQDRSAQLDPAHFDHIVPGKNGMFLATVVRDGQVAGTWKKSTRKSEGLVATPLPGAELSSGLEELHRSAQEWAKFHDQNDLPFTLAESSA
ncbi:winged helix DNA-binding domain-containing protein [Leucobacter sp. UT-8R-CII-1-4]|uniref:winged helix DNA-binding domain-containing protein n=1 Tax=Leucobacter sp. UT-8R-CII-1-4 TaxID=3040075 RepID=UPI0024A96D6C|nr:winged helix DNA-binding domain-containing protein [Leucobacter sp. UT-8R-CII-1-4]MDI6023329.1 winged helix DNA-binding domain-containing protein [Leucobacter sp. UT-8R-CII-1-4]